MFKLRLEGVHFFGLRRSRVTSPDFGFSRASGSFGGSGLSTRPIAIASSSLITSPTLYASSRVRFARSRYRRLARL